MTVPMAPLLKTTVLLAATGSKPVPLMVMVEVLLARLVAELVTVGGAI